MSENEKRTKPRYEAPIVVVLGELARGSGDCLSGSGDADYCSTGVATGNCGGGSEGGA